VKSVGGTTSTARTPDQTEFAHFWADRPGLTFTPPGHWNQIAQDAALSRRLKLTDEAQLFALLNRVQPVWLRAAILILNTRLSLDCCDATYRWN
jgi:hypothetical protein